MGCNLQLFQEATFGYCLPLVGHGYACLCTRYLGFSPLTVAHSTMSFVWDPRQALHHASCWNRQRRAGLAMPWVLSCQTFWWEAAHCFGCPLIPFLQPHQGHAGLWSSSLWELFTSPASLHQAVRLASSPYFWCSISKSSTIKTN